MFLKIVEKLPESIVLFKKNGTWDVVIHRKNGQMVTVSFFTEKEAKKFAYSLPLFSPHCRVKNVKH